MLRAALPVIEPRNFHPSTPIVEESHDENSQDDIGSARVGLFLHTHRPWPALREAALVGENRH
jgi:hypothetical protein